MKSKINGCLFNPHIFRLLFALLMATRNEAIDIMLEDEKFDVNYRISWGDSHVRLLDNRREVELSMDKYSGAGFESRQLYSSGFFAASIKLPTKNSNGVVTSFYLSSQLDGQSGNHNELDFEFLGGAGPNYTVQTNVFSLDTGGREQRINLWFDPTQSFHTYAILWNQHHIVFYVDNKPIRVFKNNTGSGVVFPTKEMGVRASMWNGESWAGQQGKKIDWSQSPFIAHYRGLGLQACQSQNPREKCYSADFWWNKQEFWSLEAKKQKEYQNIMANYLIYDYCWKGSAKHKECSSPLKKY